MGRHKRGHERERQRAQAQAQRDGIVAVVFSRACAECVYGCKLAWSKEAAEVGPWCPVLAACRRPTAAEGGVADAEEGNAVEA